jgi:hypothetical protein
LKIFSIAVLPALLPMAHAATDLIDWLIVPGKRVGPITAKTTRADLVRYFGEKNIEDTDIVVSDGGREPGTLVFGGQPDAALGVLWTDEDNAGSLVRGVIVCYGSPVPNKCRWHTAEAISFGTELKTLERLNGRKFKLNGFDWGYGGLVTSWEGGRLQPLASACGRVNLRLDPAPGPASDERSDLIEQLEGEVEFWSSDGPMQALNPAVDHIGISFQSCNK